MKTQISNSWEWLERIKQKVSKEIQSSLTRCRDEKVLDHLLWVGILIITYFVITNLVGLRWVAILTSIFIILGRIFYNMQPQGFLTIFSILIAAHQLYLQNVSLEAQLKQDKALEDSLKQQTKQFILDKRPYLFVEFSQDLYLQLRSQDILCGAGMIFNNSGRLPATIVDTECIVSDNTGRFENYKQWHKGTHGGFPEIRIIPPQSIRTPPKDSIPGISLDASIVSISVVVTYRGPESNSLYWTQTSQVWKIEKDKQGNFKKPFFLDRKDDWDGCKDKPAPELARPDWSQYR